MLRCLSQRLSERQLSISLTRYITSHFADESYSFSIVVILTAKFTQQIRENNTQDKKTEPEPASERKSSSLDGPRRRTVDWYAAVKGVCDLDPWTHDLHNPQSARLTTDLAVTFNFDLLTSKTNQFIFDRI